MWLGGEDVGERGVWYLDMMEWSLGRVGMGGGGGAEKGGEGESGGVWGVDESGSGWSEGGRGR